MFLIEMIARARGPAVARGSLFMLLAMGLSAPGCAPRALRPAESGEPQESGRKLEAGAPAAGSPAKPQPVAPGGQAAAQASGNAAAPQRPPVSPAAAIDRGLNWLISKQNKDGGYGPPTFIPGTSDVGITAFVLYALARAPRGYKEHDGPYISKAAEFLTSRQQPDGAIYDPRDPSLQNYKTSVAMLALLALDPVKHSETLKKALEFVKAQQFDESKGYEREKHDSFGGIGYGGDPGRADLSNTQLAAEAAHQAGLSGSDDLWVRLQVFLTRCQNLETVDPVVKAAGVGTSRDGGLRYAPTQTRGNTESLDGDKVFSSYGSMTYAGLKTFLYAQVDRNDPRVQAAFNWIRTHFTVAENPGMATPKEPIKGQQGLYYYYHTMAKALAAYGEPVLQDEHGKKHLWAKELSDHIASLQRPDGSWANPAERWMESIPQLDTAYAIVALTVCLEELKKPQASDSAPKPEPKQETPAGGPPAGQRK
jgi:squalene-hopene/tetraprenyl-beta-curcumene cyclase